MKFLPVLFLVFTFSESAFAKKKIRCDVAIKCAAPPEGCNWTMEQDKKGCTIGCGELLCSDPQVECPPMPQCAAPPQGCNWNLEYDENKCVVSCGPLTCSQEVSGLLQLRTSK